MEFAIAKSLKYQDAGAFQTSSAYYPAFPSESNNWDADMKDLALQVATVSCDFT